MGVAQGQASPHPLHAAHPGQVQKYKYKYKCMQPTLDKCMLTRVFQNLVLSCLDKCMLTRVFQNLVLVLPVRHRALHQCLATNSDIFNLKVQVHILRKSESSFYLWLDSDPLLLGRDQERKK